MSQDSASTPPAGIPRRYLLALLALAAAFRVYVLATEDAFLHPDAIFQGLEPAYDMVWGGGELPWEFDKGIRSWAWPALLAAPMAMLGTLGIAGPGVDMAPAILSAQLLCVVLDLLALWALCRLLWARTSPTISLLFAGLYAVHPAFTWPGTQPLIDLPATLMFLWTLERGFGPPASASAPTAAWTRQRARGFGASFAAAWMLRVQLWPALLVAGAWLAWSRRQVKASERQLMPVFASAFGVVLAFGLVDWLTWGAPSSSTVEYLRFNLGEGGSSFGQMPADRYWAHAAYALPGLRLPLLALCVWGAIRAPGLALVVLAFFVPHQVLSYRVWRFVQPGLPLLLVLGAIGVHDLLARTRESFARPILGLVALAFVGSAASALATQSLWETTWLFNQGGQAAVERSRALHRAYAHLSAQPDPQDLVQAVLPAGGAPGRASLGQAVRIAHPMGGAPPPPFARHIISTEQLPAAKAAGFAEIWRDPEGELVIVQVPRP